MTIICSHHLQRSDLERLGCDLTAQVRRDRHEIRSAVNRSLALHHEQLSEHEALDFENAPPAEVAAD